MKKKATATKKKAAPAKPAGDLHARVKRVIEEIRPAVQGDGGDVELVGIEKGVVQLRLSGACVSCPMSIYTLKLGIEQQIKKTIKEIDRVEQV